MTTPSSPKITPRAIIAFFLYVALFSFVPLLISGHWDWWQGWAYAIVMVLASLISRILAARQHPNLLAERGRFTNMPDAKVWDKKLAPMVGLIGPILTLIVCGLDARFAWSPAFPDWAAPVALVVLVLSDAFASWALVENRFFSGMVRIQTERGHRVVDSGPYHYVRHPGYLGATLTFLSTPILLGSSWALLPTVVTIILMILRTALEDQTLQDELPGYKEYAHRTRYRLFPGIW